MKVLIKGMVLVGFTLVAFFIVDQVLNTNKTNTPISDEDFADTKYAKKLGEAVVIDSIELIVTGYSIDKEAEGYKIVVSLIARKLQSGESSLQASFFQLKSASNDIYFPDIEKVEIANVPKVYEIKFSVPPSDVGYVAYWLHLNSISDPQQRAIVSIYKNYRSEG
jgi:hypothetical protein